MKSLIITVTTFLLTSAIVGNAYYQKKQFFPTVVHITKSSPGIAVIYLQLFSLLLIIGNFLKKIFFGEIRQIEVEHLMEKSWYAVTETCLALTVFRDDFTPKFVSLFVLLFFWKTFHWLAEERVDFMERSPIISLVFHVRIISLLIVLFAVDMNFLTYAYDFTISKGASVQLVFGFEYAILLTVLLNIFIKYLLHFVDLRRQQPWEHKALFLLHTELVMSFVKVALYGLFAFIIFRMYTFPVFVLRSMYHTIREFRKAFSDVILSRRAIRNMNTLYPDATPEELSAEDNLCIICREEMNVGVASKKLPCNHIFHTTCLRSWFQRQQTCPTCRLNILRTPLRVNNRQNRPPQRTVPEQQQQPNVSTTSQPTGNTSQNAGDSVAGSSATVPPNGSFSYANQMFCPPFNQMIFNVAPPLPPFNSLSDDELRTLERQMREGLDARIRCLQNIQTLLDTSVVMLQQYCSVVALTQQRPSSNPVDVSTLRDNKSTSSNDQTSTMKVPSALEHENCSVDKIFKQDSSVSSCSSSNSEEQNVSLEQGVVRKRRLEMFDKSESSSKS